MQFVYPLPGVKIIRVSNHQIRVFRSSNHDTGEITKTLLQVDSTRPFQALVRRIDINLTLCIQQLLL